jgi:hypothetical protein
MGPRKGNCDFIENSCYDYSQISVICGGHIYMCNCIGGIFKKITNRAPWIQMRNIYCVESSVIGQTDFILIWYSATKRGPLRNIDFVSKVT